MNLFSNFLCFIEPKATTVIVQSVGAIVVIVEIIVITCIIIYIKKHKK